MKSLNELFDKVLMQVSADIHVQCPCRVVSVEGNFVNAVAIINDEEIDFVLYNIPIKREETQNGYLYFKIAEGDYGTLRFYDRSIDDYINGDERYNGDKRLHSIQDRCFELGFIPNPKAYVYGTSALIELGCKDGATNIQLNNGEITINATNVNINGNVTVKGTLTADTIVANNGTSGTFANSVTATNGIVTNGS